MHPSRPQRRHRRNAVVAVAAAAALLLGFGTVSLTHGLQAHGGTTKPAVSGPHLVPSTEAPALTGALTGDLAHAADVSGRTVCDARLVTSVERYLGVPDWGPVAWPARPLYLPLSSPAVARGFQAQERRQMTKRPAALRKAWADFVAMAGAPWCRSRLPECTFFDATATPLLFAKCCAEHAKLRAATVSAAAIFSGSAVFLDSGTLIAAWRDNGTLVPWDTDVDLAVATADPGALDAAVRRTMHQGRRAQEPESVPGIAGPTAVGYNAVCGRYAERCVRRTKQDRPRYGLCKDSHYVYFAADRGAASADTSRVEVWPFHLDKAAGVGGGTLVHPTRPWCSVATALVLPTRPCPAPLFGLEALRCPRNTEAVLDQVYPAAKGGWRRPQTIHWGERNVKL